jgi:hypothetical protein
MNNENNSEVSFDIFKAVQLAGIFIGDNISIKVNSYINHFDRIHKLFENYKLQHECYTPSAAEPPVRFDLHFGHKTDFQDLFIVVAILKNFGLQAIFLSDDNNNEVLIGSYITKYGNRKDISEGIAADSILELPFMFTTSEFLKECFGIEESIDSSENLEEEYDANDHNDSYDYYDEPDYERDTFDALTDGQYGDYDDWRDSGGDMDSLRDGLGF